jgi:hypothetical protein
MANYEDLLKKNKKRIAEIKQEPKKLIRSGPRRPWQLEDKEDQSSLDKAFKEQEGPAIESFADPSPSLETTHEEETQVNLKRRKISEQNRNNTGTVSEQISATTSKVPVQKRNNIGTGIDKSVAENSPLSIDLEVSEQKYRNNTVTVSEQITHNKEFVPVQNRNNTGTESRPDTRNYSVEKVNEDIRSNDDGIKVSEQKYRNNTGTVSEQSYRAGTVPEQSRNSKRTNVGTVPVQIDVYSIPKSEEKILRVLIKICIHIGKTITPKITYEKLSGLSNTPIESCKTLVKRLEKKGFLNRIDMRKGPGSWTIFEIPQPTYQAFLTYETQSNNFGAYFNNEESTGTNIGTGRGTDIRTSGSSSSNLDNNINTNTEEVVNEHWKEIQIPEFLKTKGFSSTHAKQIFSDKENTFTVNEVQQSLEHFAYDLENNLVVAVKRGVPPINFFMGILRKNGARNLYVSSVAVQKEQAEIELYLKAQRESEDVLKKKAMAELEIKATEMVNKLSEEERNAIAPPNKFMESGSATQTMILVNHFKKESGIEI